MATKLGNGGHGQENYDPNTGKYVDDGILNKNNKKLSINSNELNDNLIKWQHNNGGMSARLAYMLKQARIYTKSDFINAITKPDFKLNGKKSYREAMKIGDFISKNNRFPNITEWEEMVPFEPREEEKDIFKDSSFQQNDEVPFEENFDDFSIEEEVYEDLPDDEEEQAMKLFGIKEGE